MASIGQEMGHQILFRVPRQYWEKDPFLVYNVSPACANLAGERDVSNAVGKVINPSLLYKKVPRAKLGQEPGNEFGGVFSLLNRNIPANFTMTWKAAGQLPSLRSGSDPVPFWNRELGHIFYSGGSQVQSLQGHSDDETANAIIHSGGKCAERSTSLSVARLGCASLFETHTCF